MICLYWILKETSLSIHYFLAENSIKVYRTRKIFSGNSWFSFFVIICSSPYLPLKPSDNFGKSCLGIICAIKDRNREKNFGILSSCTFDLNNPLDDAGTTLLHTAAKWGDLELSKELLMKGANVSIKNSLGETPLHIVARQQLKGHHEKRTHNRSPNYEIIRLMLHYNADIHMNDSSNKTLKDIFMENKDDRFKTLILTNQFNTSSKMII